MITSLGSAIGPAVATNAVKTAVNCVTFTAVRLRQTMAVAHASINSKIEDAKVQLRTLISNCSANTKELNEEEEINKILCHIKAKQKKNDTELLEENTLKTLCGILNSYSNGIYIAMTKEDYDKEKETAINALVTLAGTTAFTNTAVDTAAAAVTAAANTAKTAAVTAANAPSAPPPPTPDDIVAKFGLQSSIAAGVAVGNVVLGIAILERFKEKIPPMYLPDLKVLNTVFMSLQNEKNQAKEIDSQNKKKLESTIVDNIIEQFKLTYPERVHLYNGEFLEKTNPRITKQPSYPRSYKSISFPIGDEKITILEMDIDFKNKTLNSVGGPNYGKITDAINTTYNLNLAKSDKLDQKLKVITDNQKKVKKLMLDYSTVFDMTNETEELIKITQELNELLSNYNLQHYDDNAIESIQKHILQMQEDKYRKAQEERKKQRLASCANRTCDADPQKINQQLKEAFTNAGTQAKNVVSNIGTQTKNAVSNIGAQAKNEVSNIGAHAKNAITNLATSGSNFLFKQPNGGKRSRHNRKRKTQKQNKKTHKRR